MGSLVSMKILILRNNSLSGQLASSLKNLSNNLVLLALGENMFHGTIPSFIGESLHQLVILSLRFNNFNESLPSKLGNFYNQTYQNADRLLKSKALISQATILQIWSSIPSSLVLIDRLSMLDLSNNQLYGKIPIGTQLQTFNASCVEDNSNLCGEPLDRKCHGDEPTKHEEPTTDDAGNENSIFLEALYMSMGIGFFTGFIGLDNFSIIDEYGAGSPDPTACHDYIFCCYRIMESTPLLYKFVLHIEKRVFLVFGSLEENGDEEGEPVMINSDFEEAKRIKEVILKDLLASSAVIEEGSGRSICSIRMHVKMKLGLSRTKILKLSSSMMIPPSQ
ncbi:receptor-like protein 33 [Vicia villosa]|uniref:receptor-like protein 33 n=1 Tax=Vicia villosa TaxID=3911 RepID=UPI00273C0537|nr:receptor-like protein 33 [Vicia villosa]